MYVKDDDPLLQELRPGLNTGPILRVRWKFIITLMIGIIIRVFRVRTALNFPVLKVALPKLRDLTLATLHKRW